jgi:hypothetical protein
MAGGATLLDAAKTGKLRGNFELLTQHHEQLTMVGGAILLNAAKAGNIPPLTQHYEQLTYSRWLHYARCGKNWKLKGKYPATYPAS